MHNSFERLLALAADPNLIPGIYNYCDGRCPRCPFNERCLSLLDARDLEAQQLEQPVPAASMLERSLQRTIEFLHEVAAREGFDLSTAIPAAPEPAVDPPDHSRDPLVALAREYAGMTYPVI